MRENLYQLVKERYERGYYITDEFEWIRANLFLNKKKGKIVAGTCAERDRHPDPTGFGLHAQARLLPSGPETGECAVQRDRDGQAGRLWSRQGDPVAAALHRLRVHQMV